MAFVVLQIRQNGQVMGVRRAHELGLPWVRTRLGPTDRRITVTVTDARKEVKVSGQLLPTGHSRELSVGESFCIGDRVYVVQLVGSIQTEPPKSPGHWQEMRRLQKEARRLERERKLAALPPQGTPWDIVLQLEDGTQKIVNGRPVDLYGAMVRKATDGRRAVIDRLGVSVVSRGQPVTHQHARFSDGAIIEVAGRQVKISVRFRT